MCGFFRSIRLIIILICLSGAVQAQSISKDGSIIYWTKNYRLNFADFQGKPGREDSAHYAVNAKTPIHRLGALTKSIDVQLKTSRGRTTFTIHAGMKKNLSWIKNDGDTISLKHEQGHFDICELYARILRREIRKAKSLTEAKEMFERISEVEEIDHDHFDKENTFQSGGVTPDWKLKIYGRLKNLELYNNPVVIVPIYK